MENLIGANEMQAGDTIRFYGADFVLGEVTRWTGDDGLEVCRAKGVTENPSDVMLGDCYFYDNMTKQYRWTFQGNKFATLNRVS